LEALKREGFRKRGTEKFQEDLGVLSLTANGSSLLMWAHYAQSHEGMLVEFRSSKMFTNAEILLVPIEYSLNRPSVNIGKSGQHDDFAKRTAPFRVKGRDWQYEAEWRSFARLSKCTKQENSDIGEVVHLFQLGAKAVQRVVLGHRMGQRGQELVLHAVASNPNLRHVQIEHAEVDQKRFRLNYVRGPHPF
jgi:hypothetical protein